MFTGLQVKKFPAIDVSLAGQGQRQEESKGRSPEAAPVQEVLVTGQSVGQAIPAEKGNPSGLVEGQSAPALPNVPVGGSASPSVGGPATSLVGGSASPLVGGLDTFLDGGSDTPSLGGLAGSGSHHTGEVHPGSDSRVHHHGDSLGEEEKMNNNGGPVQ